MRVAHLCAPAAFGGLERVVYGLATGQKREGYDVSVITLIERGRPEPAIVGELRSANVPVSIVSLPHRSYLEQRRSVLRLCRLQKPDVLHTHGYVADVLVASLGSTFSAARVTTVHGFTGGGWRNRFYEWLQRRAFGRFDAVVAVSGELGRRLRFSGSKQKLAVVQNAYSPPSSLRSRDSAQAQLGLSGNVFNIAWIGRLTPEKGADILVDALPLLRGLPIHVTFIGEGIQRRALTARAAKLGVEFQVSWLGALPEAGSMLPGFDALVLSSRTEGTPIALFEAMHANVPIVAAAVGGVPAVLSGNEAVLIPPDNPAALAAAVRKVYEDADAAKKRAAHANKRLAGEFAAQPWIDRYRHIYQRALGAKK